MLGNHHRPENANRLGFGNHVSDRSQRLLRQSRDPRSGSDGEGLETGSVLLEAVYPFIQKLGMGKSFVQQIAIDRAEHQRSAPGLGCGKRSARLAISFSRKSETISLCPSSLWELLTRVAMTG